MNQQITLGVTAIALGVLIGVALFVPFVAISYRRRGHLSVGRTALWAAALVYFLAIWIYTLLPLPAVESLVCAGTNLDPFEFVADVRRAIGQPGNAFTNPLVLQLILNVALFVPLGFFVRVLGNRGIITAILVGLGVSLFIETTQLTGVWGLYPCAYRVFDVDDLMTNTTGAAIGSLFALMVPRGSRGMARLDDADVPRPVTKGRRLIAMLCDALTFAFLTVVVAVGTQLSLTYFTDDQSPVFGSEAVALTSRLIPAAVWLVIILATGRSVGDLAVQLRYSGGPLPVAPARILRWAGGISAYALLGLLPSPWSLTVVLFILATLVLVFTTERGRGLPGLLSAMHVDDARLQAPLTPATPSGSSGDVRAEG